MDSTVDFGVGFWGHKIQDSGGTILNYQLILVPVSFSLIRKTGESAQKIANDQK
jgi:hypothetical protein